MSNLEALEAASDLVKMGFGSAIANGDGVHLDSDDASRMVTLLSVIESAWVDDEEDEVEPVEDVAPATKTNQHVTLMPW